MTEKRKTYKRPKNVKWLPSPSGKSYGWRYPDGTTWNCHTAHPRTGKGGKGVKKSAAHRAAISAAMKKTSNTPKERARHSERIKKQWEDPENREAFLNAIRKGAVNSHKARQKRAVVRKQTERALQAKLGWHYGSTTKEKRMVAIKQTATRALAPYGVELLDDQPMKYYIEIIEAFAPDLKPALDRYLKSF